MRIYLLHPIINLRKDTPVRWVMADSSILDSIWNSITSPFENFLNEYFKEDSELVLTIPSIPIDPKAVVNTIAQEQSQAFGNAWERDCIYFTTSPAIYPTSISCAAGEPMLQYCIYQLFIRVFMARMLAIYTKRFKRHMTPALDVRMQSSRPTFKTPREDTEMRIHCMSIAMDSHLPLTKTSTDHLNWAADHLARPFAMQRAGHDISVMNQLNEIENAGFQVFVVENAMYNPFECPITTLIPTMIGGSIPTQTRYRLDIFKDGNFWKGKRGILVPYAYLEMWYKILNQMDGETSNHYTIVLTNITCPKLQESGEVAPEV